MSLKNLIVLTGLSQAQAKRIITAVSPSLVTRLGRPHRLRPNRRILLVLVWLRTNLTERALGAVFGVSQPTAHRVIQEVLPLLASQHPNVIPEGKEHLFLDGTLIPVEDHSLAKKSKNYRRSANAQVVCDHKRRVVFVGTAWPGNRNDIIVARETVPTGRTFKTDGAYRTFPGAITPPPRNEPRKRQRHIQVRARAEHTIARMKDWQILRQCRSRDGAIDQALQAVAFAHNVRMGHIPIGFMN